MSVLYTIGFTKKSAQEFFGLLTAHKVKTVLDVRLNNSSQLAAFSKYPDIEFFLQEIAGINYIHDSYFAPTKDILSSYKHNEISWADYETQFHDLMAKRQIADYIDRNYAELDNVCLLCSEEKPDFCHRRLLAELMSDTRQGVNIIHLQ